MKNKDIKWVNVAKGLGIIAVVIGHTGSPINKYLYLFHMALFFFLSGYLYKDHYTNNFWQFIKRRVVSLYLPFVKYQTIFFLLRNIFFNLNIYSENVLIGGAQMGYVNYKESLPYILKAIITFNGVDPLLSAFWFLQTLFFVNIAFFIVCKISSVLKVKKAYIQFILIICVFIAGFIAIYSNFDYRIFNQNNRLSVGMLLNLIQPRVLIVLSVYYLGYLYKKYEDIIAINIKWTSIFIIVLFILPHFGSVEISAGIYTNPIFFLLASITGIYITIYFAKLINLNFKSDLLKYMGQNSMIIMAFHLISFKAISLLQVVIYGYDTYNIAAFPILNGSGAWWILYSIVGVLLPILIKYLCDVTKNKIRVSFGYKVNNAN